MESVFHILPSIDLVTEYIYLQTSSKTNTIKMKTVKIISCNSFREKPGNLKILHMLQRFKKIKISRIFKRAWTFKLHRSVTVYHSYPHASNTGAAV